MWRNNGSHYALHLGCISTFHREICRSDRRGGSNRWNRFCCCSHKPVGNSCCACGQCKAWARPRMSRVVRPIAGRTGRHIFPRLVRTTGPYRTRLRRRRRTVARWALRAPCREASRRVPAPRRVLKQGPERIIWPVVGCEASIFSHVAQELGIVCPGGDLPQMNSVWQVVFAV